MQCLGLAKMPRSSTANVSPPYDVATLLGDVVATVEKHYAPFVRELRERARQIMELGTGLEQIPGTPRARQIMPTGKIN